MERYLWDDYSRRVTFDRGQKERPRQKYKDFPDIHRYVACAALEYKALAGGGYGSLMLNNFPERPKRRGINPYLRH